MMPEVNKSAKDTPKKPKNIGNESIEAIINNTPPN
jgi:hypothetical protein